MKRLMEKIKLFFAALPSYGEKVKQRLAAKLSALKPFWEKTKEKSRFMMERTVSGIRWFFSAVIPSKQTVLAFFIRWWHWVLAGVFAFLVLYYPIGALMTHKIDKSTELKNREASVNSPAFLSTASALIDREINQHVWTPGLPFIFPASILTRMPNYQMGILSGVRTVVVGLSKDNPQNEALERIIGHLSYPPKTWYITRFKPSTPARLVYGKALDELSALRRNLEEDKDVLIMGDGTLLNILETVEKALQVDIFRIRQRISKTTLVDMRATDMFYNLKGQAYAFYMILSDLKLSDFKPSFEPLPVEGLMKDALASLKAVVDHNPLIVTNGSRFLPNDLVFAGFHLASAKGTLTEIRLLLMRNLPDD